MTNLVHFGFWQDKFRLKNYLYLQNNIYMAAHIYKLTTNIKSGEFD